MARREPSRAATNFQYANRGGYAGRGRYDESVPLPQPRPQGSVDYHSQGEYSEYSEEEDVECPLCLEPMDETDRTFYPCPCGYQICLYCFNRVKDKNDKCPACRAKYNADAYQYVAPEEDSESRHRSGSVNSIPDDEEQLEEMVREMAMARARAMAAQARRCGACQVEGPPLEPDPTYDVPPEPTPHIDPQMPPRTNSWATLAAGGPGFPSTDGAWGNSSQSRQDPWQQGWPTLDDAPTGVGVDEWDVLAQAMVNETIVDSGKPQSRLLAAQAEAVSQEGEHLDASILVLESDVSRIQAALVRSRTDLDREDQLYDHYQEKCAHLRLQQQNWDAGIIDLLSKWQGWTDNVERTEAAHFEKESELMAKLITHQQNMAEMISSAAEQPLADPGHQQTNNDAHSNSSWSAAPPGISVSHGIRPNPGVGLGVTENDEIWERPIGRNVSRMSSWESAPGLDVSAEQGWSTVSAHPKEADSGGWSTAPARGGANNAWGAAGANGQEGRTPVVQPSVWGGGNGLW